jgi:S1-C subfamily serine protease
VKDVRFGFSARQLGYDDKVQRKVSTETQGVIVTKVERSGWADLSGLRAGDIVFTINGIPVTDNLTLRAALAQLATTKPRHVVFQVRRSISGAYLEFEPDWAAFESIK